jgi:hypothetical protein
MTYTTGGNIQAADYNAFSTLSTGMNELFADSNSGATTLPLAGFGYGQTPALTGVVAGNSVQAIEWAALFNTMKNCGTHQGTVVVPPVPSVNPVATNTIAAFNSPSSLASVIALLKTNKYNIAALQSTVVAGTPHAQPAGAKPWSTSLVWNYQANFSSWNNARYFFNSGGAVLLNGSYSPSVTPEDAEWVTLLTNMSPLSFKAESTSPATGTGGTSVGFYGLTTSYQTVYNKVAGGGGTYSTSSILVQAKLAAAAGTNGLVDFKISLLNGDLTPNPKTSTTTYQVDIKRSSGAIVYPGPVVTVASVGANDGFVAT